MFASMIFPVFMGIVAALFFVLPVKLRPGLLLISSYIFCGWIEIRALAVLILISLCAWVVGIKIGRLQEEGKKSAAKRYLTVTVCLFILLLCIYKYMPYLLQRSAASGELPEGLLKNLAMPVGLSFYLFQAVGYLADIYAGRCRPEKSFLAASCYFAFFPKLVSGPIERGRDFLPQFQRLAKEKFWDRGKLSMAAAYMLWGYFMKMVVADRLAVTVNQIFAYPELFDSFWLILGAFLYTMQIYCDFAGYSYIAIGCAQVFGIRLTQNFKAPYCAGGISDFWRRWHISLSSWLRDYLYIPLGGNRKGMARKCLNTMIVFLVCGMWHGVGMNFVAWGLLHGIYSVAETCAQKAGWKIRGGRAVTFVSVAFAWIFFRAESLRAALRYVKGIFTAGIHPGSWLKTAENLHLSFVEVLLIVLSVAVVWAADELCNRKKLNLPVLIQGKENAARYLVFYLLIISIFIFGMYGPGYHAEQFIYMQF